MKITFVGARDFDQDGDRDILIHNATTGALRKAEELGLDIDEVEGSGAQGRVTVHDVEKAGAAG